MLKIAERMEIRVGLQHFTTKRKGYSTSDLFPYKRNTVPAHCKAALKSAVAQGILAYRNKRYWLVVGDIYLMALLADDARVDALVPEEPQQKLVFAVPQTAVPAHQWTNLPMALSDLYAAVTAGRAEVKELQSQVRVLTEEQDAMSKLFMEKAETLHEIHVLFRMFAEQDDFFAQIRETHRILKFMEERILEVKPPSSQRSNHAAE